MVADLTPLKRSVAPVKPPAIKPAPEIQFGAVKLKDRSMHYGKISQVVFAGRPFVCVQAGDDIRLIDGAEVSQLKTVSQQQLFMLNITLKNIIEAVAEYFQVTEVHLCSRQRTEVLCRARFFAFAIAREAGYTLSETGRAFGRDHGTVINGLRSLDNWLATDSEVKKAFDELSARIGLVQQHTPKRA